MKLSDNFKPEFREMIDAVEPWLSSQEILIWNKLVVYVTDAKPEFDAGKTQQRFHGRIMDKDQAIAWERENGTECSARLIQALQAPQEANRCWVVASSAENHIHAVECIVMPLMPGGSS